MDAPNNYEAPIADTADLGDETEDAWQVFVGFVIAIALAYGAYCTSKGGDFKLNFSWRRGYLVKCFT